MRVRHRTLDIDPREQCLELRGKVRVPLVTDPLKRRCHHRFRSPPHLVIQRLLVGKSAEPRLREQALGFDATATVKRSDFGVDKYAPNVSDEVKLQITAEAIVPKPDAAK